MSMTTLTIVQAVSIFAAYLFTTIALPALVFHRRLQYRRIAERIIFYFLFGNTYVVNLVLYLGLLKILNRWTLLLFTVVPFYLGWTYLNHVAPQSVFRNVYVRFRRLFTGIFGAKNAIYRIRILVVDFVRKWVPKLWRVLYKHLFEWILLGLLALAIVWTFGEQLVTQLGYGASDIPVHNMWVNYLSPHEGKKGMPFGAGVYPFGFHCIVYFLHEVFGFDTYVIFRVFFIGQDFMIYFMLAMFIKLTSKTKYLGYAAAIAALVFRGFRPLTHLRYASSLPQEHGMIYILPGIYFLFLFFNERRVEVAKKKKELGLQRAADKAALTHEVYEDPESKRARELRQLKYPMDKRARERELAKEQRKRQRLERQQKRESRNLGSWGAWKRRRKETRLTLREMKVSWYCLAGFVMSFGMSLAVHFYDTMIAGLFVLAVGVAFVFWIFRRYYFWSVLMAGIFSVVIAVLPMAIAVIGGTPLQGSLGWGLSIVTGKQIDVSGKDKDAQGSTEEPSEQETSEAGQEGEASPDSDSSEAVLQTGTESVPGSTQALVQEGVWMWDTELATEVMYKGGEKIVKPLPLKGRLKKGAKGIVQRTETTVFTDEFGKFLTPWVLIATGALALLGAFFWLLRQWFYGSRLLASALYIGFLMVMMAAKDFGLPALMDPARSCIFLSYSITIPFALLLDGICYLIRLIVRWKKSMQLLSLLLSAAVIVGGIRGRLVGGSIIAHALQTNSAITCLTNIIDNNEDFTYTIISASDERNMAFDHAYHTELITFLRQMEFYNSEKKFTIPSRKIFVFVEKIPVEFGLPAKRKGQRIDRNDANRMIDFGSGISAYQGDTRWTTMSRAYYWAESFEQMYPDEMSVYFETDEFVCFEIRQNPYREFNLAIDYGYNTVDWRAVRPEKW